MKVTRNKQCFQERFHAGACSGSETLGSTSTSSNKNSLDGKSDTQYVLRDSEFVADCCGYVRTWGIYADANGTIIFEVWRPDGFGGFTLVGQNIETAPNTGALTFSIPQNERIGVQDNDVIGWFASGDNIVNHKDDGGGYDNNYFISGTAASTIGDTINLSNSVDSRNYAIYARLTAGNDPTFDNLDNSVSFYKNEASTSTPIFTVAASDQDLNDAVTLSLNSISPSPHFDLDTTTGEITPNTLSLTAGVYTIDVRATDVCGNKQDGTLTVNILNTAPVIHSLPVVLDISESAVDETLLHIVNVTDTDGDLSTCSMSSSPSGPFMTKFRSDASGELTTGVYLQSNPNLDYTTASSYVITVTCTDPNSASDSGELYVYVIQNDVPVITNLQNITSITSTLSTNTQIFQVEATDVEGDQTYFTLTCTIASPCPFSIFSTGALYLTTSLVGTTASAYELDIAVYDDFSSSGTHRLTVFVTDLNTTPEPSNLPATIQVNEDTPVGTTVFTVSFYDEDGDTSHTFSSSFAPAAGNAIFALDSATGAVTLTTALNYLSQDRNYDVTVDVTDLQGASSNDHLYIEIVDVNVAPQLYQTNYMITDNEGAAGTVLPDPGFNVVDVDGDTLTYSFDGGDSSDGFNINSATGLISFSVDYDVDDTSLSNLLAWRIKISDPEGLAVTATLTVSVLDVNDNAPQLSATTYSASTYSDLSLGTTVLTVSATDRDLTAVNSQLEYTVQGTSLFGIDNSGNIFVFGSLINLAGTTETFTITVTNPGTNLSNTASVSIFISEPESDDYFDDGGNIAWVTLVCVLGVGVLSGLGYLGYRFYQKHWNTPLKPSQPNQVAPHDTALPRSRGRPQSQISTSRPTTVVSFRSVATPSDIRFINNQWEAWSNKRFWF